MHDALVKIRAAAQDARDLAGWADQGSPEGIADVVSSVIKLADTVRDLTLVVAGLTAATKETTDAR